MLTLLRLVQFSGECNRSLMQIVMPRGSCSEYDGMEIAFQRLELSSDGELALWEN